MPTYEYRCPSGHVFEKFFQSISNRRRVACPTCGKLAERLISGGAGLVFKGSGFYITDYKRAGEPKRESQSESKSEAKSESKPSETPKKPKKDH
ncbi:MAG TPA: zinc ribbon domain-containing protein [Gemmatimonadales bacterium]|nr:zinc ribbon domain-containing protein [Gemmatimonadales bacterium]